MRLTHFTTLVPVESGREEALRKALAGLGAGSASPFHHVAGTHMARLYVLDHYQASRMAPLGPRSLTPALFVFSAVVDGPVAPWLEKLPAEIGPLAESLWIHCTGFPGTSDSSAFARWLLDYEQAPIFPLVANDRATVETVRRGLDLRVRLAEFAARMQGAAPTAVRAAYRKEFGR